MADIPHPASTHLDMHSEYDSLDGAEIEDMLSEMSDESEISATQLATDPHYAVLWELLNNCCEAAFGDIPRKYRDCLSVFDTEHSGTEVEDLAYQKGADSGQYDGLFRVAGATKTTTEPWSLPSPARRLPDEDALWRRNMRVLEVSQVNPTAAIYLAPQTALGGVIHHPDSTLYAGPQILSLNGMDGSFDNVMSPLVQYTEPLLASTVFTAASHISPHGKDVSFHVLRRYNRLATTSLLRQAHALQIDTPVFGILLRGNLVAIHVDWYEEQNDAMESYSAFYPCDDEETGIKTWDLDQPLDAHDMATILSNLRKYTFGPYASRVRQGLSTAHKLTKPWKWDVLTLPQTLSFAQLRRHHEEPVEDKMDRWQKGLDISVDQDMRTWLHRKLTANQPGQAGEACGDFMSPPSTPGDL